MSSSASSGKEACLHLAVKMKISMMDIMQQWLIDVLHTGMKFSVSWMLGESRNCYHTHTHLLTHLMALYPGLPRSADTRKVKPVWILLKQETVSCSGISWAICKSAPSSRQVITPAPHHSVFLQVGCPSCRPTNSVKALKAVTVAIPVIAISPMHSER